MSNNKSNPYQRVNSAEANGKAKQEKQIHLQIDQEDQSSSFTNTFYYRNSQSHQRNSRKIQKLLILLTISAACILLLTAGCVFMWGQLAKSRKLIQKYEFVQPNSQGLSQQDESLFKHILMVDSPVHSQLENVLRWSFYDVHYFLKDPHNCQHQNQQIIHQATQSQTQLSKQERKILQIHNSQQKLNELEMEMKLKKYRPQKLPFAKKIKTLKPQSLDNAYFMYALQKQPNNTDFIQAEFYRYDKLYNIGKYGKQLPLCISLIGRNNADNLQKLYSTIVQQNYTNYKIIHSDDSSEDDTIQKIKRMIKQNKLLQQKLTFISQKRRRNQLYNRDLTIRKYCGEDDIVLDMDADDWIIGRQAFQLVNTIYQTGQIYQGQHHQIWALYFSHIVYNSQCKCILPNIDGKIADNDFFNHTYRVTGRWRTTQLRTFRRQIYMKIDTEDFVDKESPNRQYYTESSDAFIHSAILQLSGPKHLKTIDQFLYYYVTSLEHILRRQASIDFFYSVYKSQTITPYNTLNSLDDTPTRISNFKIPLKKFKQVKIKTWQIHQKRQQFKQQLVQAFKAFMEPKQEI